jgi:hypothetical protein
MPQRTDLLAAVTYVAVVRAADGVRLAVAAPTSRGIVARLARYVRARAPETLWPADARRVRRLLARGERWPAIVEYFATVGRRWDEETLQLRALATVAGRGAAVGVWRRRPAGR